MDATLDFDSLTLLMVFVFPGLLSMQVYRMLMPAGKIEWGSAILEAFFYGAVNFILLSVLIYVIQQPTFQTDSPRLYFASWVFVLIVGPILWPIIYWLLLTKTRLLRKLQIPIPSAWDFYFDKRKPTFVLIHFKEGNMIGGYYGEKSFATSFPNQGSIYIETVYELTEEGEFGPAIGGSDGLIVMKDKISHVELFNPPTKQDQKNHDSKKGPKEDSYPNPSGTRADQ